MAKAKAKEVKTVKVKVLEPFIDKYTKKGYKEGATISVTEERLEEILKKGKLVEKVTEEAPKEPAQKAQ